MKDKEKTHMINVLILRLIAESDIKGAEISLREAVLKKEYKFEDRFIITLEDILKEMRISVIPYHYKNLAFRPIQWWWLK